MSYKNDSLLVIANKFGTASSDAKVQLYETYDRLRDLTVSGSASSGTGFEMAGGALYKVASLFAPSSFMTTLGGTQSLISLVHHTGHRLQVQPHKLTVQHLLSVLVIWGIILDSQVVQQVYP